MSRYQDSGVEEIMRESGERFEALLREMRATRAQAQADRLQAEAESPSPRKAREERWPTLRDLQKRLDELDKRDRDA